MAVGAAAVWGSCACPGVARASAAEWSGQLIVLQTHPLFDVSLWFFGGVAVNVDQQPNLCCKWWCEGGVGRMGRG